MHPRSQFQRYMPTIQFKRKDAKIDGKYWNFYTIGSTDDINEINRIVLQAIDLYEEWIICIHDVIENRIFLKIKNK